MNIESDTWRCRSTLETEFTELIARYPFLDKGEVRRLVDIYPNLRVVDVALMMADHELAPMLDDFCRDNRDAIRRMPDLKLIAIVLSGIAMLVIASFMT